MKREQLDLLLEKSLTTEETEGVPRQVRRVGRGGGGGSGEHDAHHILGVVIHQVLGPQTRLNNTASQQISLYTSSHLKKFCLTARTGFLLEKSDIELLM